MKELNRVKTSGYPTCIFHRLARTQSECYAKMGRLDKAIELMEYAIGETNELIASAGSPEPTRVLPTGATMVTLEQEKFEFMGFLASLRSGLLGEECSCGDHVEDDQAMRTGKLEMDVDQHEAGCPHCAGKLGPVERTIELTDGPNTANCSISGAVEFEEGGKIRAAKDIRPGNDGGSKYHQIFRNEPFHVYSFGQVES
jgi:hypothetical protein